jgi:hypothetical protein
MRSPSRHCRGGGGQRHHHRALPPPPFGESPSPLPTPLSPSPLSCARISEKKVKRRRVAPPLPSPETFVAYYIRSSKDMLLRVDLVVQTIALNIISCYSSQ